MIHLFAGEDSYRSREAYLAAREEARKKNGINVLRDEGLTEKALLSALNGQTIFGDSPAVALEGIAGFTGDRADGFLSILKNASASVTVLVWERTKPESRLKIWGYLQKNADKTELFSPLSFLELKKRIFESVREEGGKISENAVQLLIKICGTDLWFLESEIKKLVLCAKDREITAEDVEEVTPIEEEINIFNVVRSLALSDGKTAIRNLSVSRAMGEDSRFILSQVIKEVRVLLSIRDLMDRGQAINPVRLAAQMGVRDFVLEALQRSAGRMNTVKLHRVYDQLVVSLYALNNGRAEADDVLDMLALQSI